MSTFTGKTPGIPDYTYKGLLHFEDAYSGITATLKNIQDGLGNNTGVKLSTTELEYTGIFTFASKTASTLIYLNASKQVTSLANSAGVLTNDGIGGLSWGASGASQWITVGSDIYYDTGKVQIGNSAIGASKLNVYSATGAIMKLHCNTSTLDVQLLTTVGEGYFGVNTDALYFQSLDSLANGIYFWPNSASVAGLHLLADGSIRHEYSSTVYLSTTVGSTGIITFNAVGSDASFVFSDSIALPYVAKTANYTLTSSDSTVDATSNSFAFTLPTAVGCTGRIYTLKNSGTGIISINTTSAQTIDGVASGVLTLIQYDSLQVQSNGANWIIIN